MTPKEAIQRIESTLTALVMEARLEKNMGLLGGYSGLSLFYYANYLLSGSEQNLRLVEDIVSDSLAALDQLGPNPYFCNGLAGLAYLIHFFKENGLLDLDTETVSQLDDITYHLSKSYEQALSVNNHDFLHGGEGLWLYLTAAGGGTRVSETYLNRLNHTKQRIPNKGIAWKSNISYEGANRLVYNLGLAHGMASTLLVLGKILKADAPSTKALARDLLNGAVEFFLSEELVEGFGCGFPNYSSLDEPPRRSRLGWCYGDPGICVALWNAGDALQDRDIKQRATDLCVRTTKRKTKEETGILDAGVCHGSAGLSHIYRRMHELTDAHALGEAADYWLKETLTLAAFEDGWAGYKTWSAYGYRNDASLLDGIAGIGLVLISSQIEQLPAWDASLLLR